MIALKILVKSVGGKTVKYLTAKFIALRSF